MGFDEKGKISALKIRGYFLCGADMDLVRLPLHPPCFSDSRRLFSTTKHTALLDAGLQ